MIFNGDVELYEIFLVTGMALVTFGIRYIMFPISGRFEFPELFIRGLRYVPPVLLTAIIVPSVFNPTGEMLNFKLSNPYLIGALTACVTARLFKNLLLTIVVSMSVFLVFQWAFVLG